MSDPVDRLFARQEAVAAIGGLWRILANKCVSPPDAMQAARWKLAQLDVARRVGFQVPKTVLTTDFRVAREFMETAPAVLKAVGQAAVKLGNEERVGHTVELNDAIDVAAVRPTPALFQTRVDKAADLRVTVIGHQIFAVRIVAPVGAPLDFRLSAPADCAYDVIDLERSFESSIHRYMRHWPLRFGAFDFAEDSSGERWFLECNPAGQWGWLERTTNVQITAALVDLLLEPRGQLQ